MRQAESLRTKSSRRMIEPGIAAWNPYTIGAHPKSRAASFRDCGKVSRDPNESGEFPKGPNVPMTRPGFCGFARMPTVDCARFPCHFVAWHPMPIT
jgi:hypothetical protein